VIGIWLPILSPAAELYTGRYVDASFSFFGRKSDERDNHFFKRNTSVLECIAVVLRIIVELIGISKEIIAGTEHVTAAHIGARQSYALGLVYDYYILRGAVKCFAHLVSNIGIGIFVSQYLHGVFDTGSTVVGSKYQCESFCCGFL
jgi:hypothetical protein